MKLKEDEVFIPFSADLGAELKKFRLDGFSIPVLRWAVGGWVVQKFQPRQPTLLFDTREGE